MNHGSLYEQALGPRFGKLDESVRTFHRLRGRHLLTGWVRTEAPESLLARLFARSLGTPLEASSGAIRFELDAKAGLEVWTRHFPSRTMTSCLSASGPRLVEQLGSVRLTFGLEEAGGRMIMGLERLHFLGVPCPRWAMPRVVAEESGSTGRLHFNVRAWWPFVGQVAGYSGYLDIPSEEPM